MGYQVGRVHQGLIITGLCLAMGCSWSDERDWRGAVWADDDSVVSVVRVDFDSKPNAWSMGGVNYERNHRSQIHLVDIESQDTTPVGGIQHGEIIEHYLMKQAGYILYQLQPERFDLSEVGIITYKRLDLVTGVTTEVASVEAIMGVTCDDSSFSSGSPKLYMVPSPGGSLIAKIESEHTCRRLRVRLSFLNGETLGQVGETTTVTDIEAENTTMFIFDGAWNVWGRFMIKLGNEGVVAYSPSEEEQLLGDIDWQCLYPATTSSESNFNMQYVSYNGSELSITQGDSVFGCDELEP